VRYAPPLQGCPLGFRVEHPFISTHPEGTLLMTSVRPTARLILLNTSLGDSAVVERRDCDCRFQEIGWATHLHTIRSCEKLNSAG
jgi:hypothetical protein